MKLYLDANGIIYSIENVSPFRETVWAQIDLAEKSLDGLILTSRLSRLECRNAPLRKGQLDLLAIYDQFFTRRPVRVLEISAPIIERATELRARYNFRTPDAIHLASAIDSQADVFLTGDKDLMRCTEVAVTIL
jgi:predicted nucleic acid-binding protein